MPINFIFRSYDGYLSSVREKILIFDKKLHSFRKIFLKCFINLGQILIKNSNFCEFFENGKVRKISKFRIS